MGVSRSADRGGGTVWREHGLSADDYRSAVVPLTCEAPRPRWQEWFSWAFTQAVASASGLAPEIRLIDANQMDVLVQTWHPLGGSSCPAHRRWEHG